jgi:hypothetical protein
MPLTDFQIGVARTIAANRRPESHVAGGAVLNRGEAGLRISNDIDIFHDVVSTVQDVTEYVKVSAESDERLLMEAGYSVEWKFRGPGHLRAIVSRRNESVRLDWSTDSACRFFPAQKDEDFGYCLHPADLATNKVLALAGRCEIRDYLDILELHKNYLSLGAIVWAACGKDEGLTPASIIDLANRNSRYQESDLKSENLVRQVDLKALKQQWIAARERAVELFDKLPPEDLGCLYLDQNNKPLTPDPSSSNFPNVRRHQVSVSGAWPTIS